MSFVNLSELSEMTNREVISSRVLLYIFIIELRVHCLCVVQPKPLATTITNQNKGMCQRGSMETRHKPKETVAVDFHIIGQENIAT